MPGFQSPSRRGHLLEHLRWKSYRPPNSYFSPLREGDTYLNHHENRTHKKVHSNFSPLREGDTYLNSAGACQGSARAGAFQSPSRRGHLLELAEPYGGVDRMLEFQ